ncbi:MAG: hydantoinase/oxoprolinase family protein [Butyricicoccus sp.]
MIGLGIDTGGTCTDAVIYDMDAGTVLSVGKTLTTKERLETGIERAIRMLDAEQLKRAEFVSLSTTLATNACVEQRGGRVKLLFIGVKPHIVQQVYREYGFDSMEDIRFISGVPEGGYCKAVPPDWDALDEMMDEFREAEAIGIVQYFPEWNNGAFEKEAKARLEQRYSVPIVCGSELFSDTNAVRRGAGTYLNIRLIPIIHRFLKAVSNVLQSLQLDIPIFVVRSDGTLMNRDFTRRHPVETLLCGPAASALGGAWMADEKNALIVDIGGTTTDIAVLRDGTALSVPDGIKINGWKTFVKGMYVDTFGLGGDSAVQFDESGVYLEDYRVIPIAMIAAQYPELVGKLRERMQWTGGKMPVYEGFVLQQGLQEQRTYTPEQIALCRVLQERPLMWDEVGDICGKYNVEHCVRPLEQDNSILRFGLTPTDMMHLKGDYCAYHTEAARAAVQCMANNSGLDARDIPDLVYNAFWHKLYKNIVRVLLQLEYPQYKEGVPDEVLRLAERSYDTTNSTYLRPSFSSPFAIVGVGGPAGIFLPEMERRLGMRVFIPDNFRVANAVGTLAGRISVTRSSEIRYCSEDNVEGYRVFLNGQKRVIEGFDDAVRAVSDSLRAITAEVAQRRGAQKNIVFTEHVRNYSSSAGAGALVLGAEISVTAYGDIHEME